MRITRNVSVDIRPKTVALLQGQAAACGLSGETGFVVRSCHSKARLRVNPTRAIANPALSFSMANLMALASVHSSHPILDGMIPSQGAWRAGDAEHGECII